MYDDNGRFIKKVRLKRHEKRFRYNKKSFNIDEKEAGETNLDYWLFEKRFYHYNINNPNPFKLDKKGEPIMDSALYDIQLETKVAMDLNNLNEGNLSKLLTPRNIIIGLIVIGIIYFLLSGNSIIPK